jgi:hypothetical protein
MKSASRLVAAAIFAAAASPAFAADASKEVATAAVHAGLAAGADQPKMVQSHLQHVINCLEGPSGADFNAAPGNPCKDLGDGAIPDSAPEARKPLADAAAKAKQAMAESDIAKAKASAAEIKAGLAH